MEWNDIEIVFYVSITVSWGSESGIRDTHCGSETPDSLATKTLAVDNPYVCHQRALDLVRTAEGKPRHVISNNVAF